ncbi:polyphosphate kinase 2 family protein [Cocleimonas flava]|uniref:PPK2 family polyphosphate:nucleotide phosphotransferase n=1 Tax=Cocleimonas flava TaxID=634765 RepID=A0A4R1EYP7_9GAMM|nr:PPK2 family polyphosphate kinase [Cocleimonas flava]TCJ86977.1 PPK2 family polyphosphate:nucleotide phosphotransferase [Cocleimonas flava]
MLKAVKSNFQVGIDNQFKLSEAATIADKSELDKKTLKKELGDLRQELAELQHQLFAEDKRSLLIVFQAMDAAGKDSTIRSVFNRVNPAGCQVSSFKQPSSLELDHDFMWRSNIRAPERGKIGIFNRSYYEEGLVVRVHPDYLKYQRLNDLPETLDEKNLQGFWQNRFESFNDYEKHLARNGTLVLKFWLNVSKEEQKNRFLSRLNEPEKNWKFSSGDIKERALWNDYMHAYEELINHTSKEHAPWYAIPADNKLYMRVQVARTIVENLRAMNPQFPKVEKKESEKFDEMRRLLESE